MEPVYAASRRTLGARIHRAAELALANPALEQKARVEILGHMLHPAAGVVDRAIAIFENHRDRFPTVERERIAEYVERVIERRMLGSADEPARVDLAALVSASGPFAWCDRFAASCVRAGIREVTTHRSRRSPMDVTEHVRLGTISGLDQTLSAENIYLINERRQLIEQIEEAFAEMDIARAGRFERMRAKAGAMRRLLNIPQPHTSGIGHARWLQNRLEQPDAADAIRASIEAHRDLASGDPKWEQLAVDDRLLDLWMDYTADQAQTLLSTRDNVVRLIVADAAMLPPEPTEQTRVMLRRALKNACVLRGWPSLMMRLEAAWVAMFFDPRTDGRGRSNPQTEQAAEAARQRAELAASWPTVVEEVLAFKQGPFRPGVDTANEVAAWVEATFQEVTADRHMPLPEVLAA